MSRPAGGPVRRLTSSEEFQYPGGVAPDGRSVVFTNQGAKSELFVLPLDASGAPGAPVRITATPELEAHPPISPDGRWVAYDASQSGRSEVYVRAYPSGSDPRKVSADGGSMPAWSHDGRELLYRHGERVMAAAVMPGREGFESAPPRPLFTAARALEGGSGRSLAAQVGVTKGQRRPHILMSGKRHHDVKPERRAPPSASGIVGDP